MIDLRSDTKTLPTVAMREFMARAPLGDDVAGEDPTVNELEEYAARLVGTEAALFVVSGTMGNLVSIYAHTRPGEELICHDQAHIYHYERSGLAAVCGLLVRPLSGRYGVLDPAAVAALYGPPDLHRQPIGLLCLENTHNNCGGTCLSPTQTRAVAAVAQSHGTRVHLDGARIFNAAVALGVSVAELVAPVDSVTFCFAKGLGAPAGSVVCGSAEFIQRAREARKLFGGGLRQAGIIAAGGLYALHHHLPRLADDHAHAQLIAETLAALPAVEIDLDSVQTNIIFFRLTDGPFTADELCLKLGELGILCSARPDGLIRFVTHLDISSAQATEVCQALQQVFAHV
jgi:threonine aldolase